MKTPRGSISNDPFSRTINRIRDELVRLRIQSSPDVKANETPTGTRLIAAETKSKKCFLARHFVESEEGEDAFGEPILIGKFQIHAPYGLFPAREESVYDNRPRIWRMTKLFSGQDVNEVTTLPTIPEENLTFNSSIAVANVVSGFWGATVVFTLTRIGGDMETNPWQMFDGTTFSMWEQVETEEQTDKLWNPLYIPENPDPAAPKETYVKVPYWLTPFGFTAPFIDEDETMMGHKLTGPNHDVVAIFKVKVYASEHIFANAVTGALDPDCNPIDNSTPVRKYGAFYAPYNATGKPTYALLRNAGSNGATSQIAMEGPYTYYTGRPERWLVPTELVEEWNEQEQRISVDDVIAAGGVLNTEIRLPVLRCIRREQKYDISAFFFNAYEQTDAEGSFNPRDAVAMDEYVDQPSFYDGGYLDSSFLGSTTELVVRAHVFQQNCDYDPSEPNTASNQPFYPWYQGGFYIKQRDSQPFLWRHYIEYGKSQQTCNEQEFEIITTTEENDDTWAQEGHPLDVYKPPQTLFFFPGTAQYEKPFSAAGFYATQEVNRPQPEPCPEPQPEE